MLSFAEVLLLNDNSFSGEIPFEIFRMRKMLEVNLGHNKLTGTIGKFLSVVILKPSLVNSQSTLILLALVFFFSEQPQRLVLANI